MLARYDFLSAGMGALVVTGFCVGRGQDVGTALWITAAATVGKQTPAPPCSTGSKVLLLGRCRLAGWQCMKAATPLRS